MQVGDKRRITTRIKNPWEPPRDLEPGEIITICAELPSSYYVYVKTSYGIDTWHITKDDMRNYTEALEEIDWL